MAGRLFKRTASVTVGPIGQLNASGLLFGTRIVFDIDKTEESNSNKAKISVYNLNADSQSFLEQGNLQIQLNAGYEDENELLFIGDIKRVNRERNGPDIIAHIECGDGEKQLQEATFVKSFGPGTTNIQILLAATKALGISIGSIVALQPTPYFNGFSFAGQVKELITELTRDQGLKWCIQDNELVIVSSDKTTLEEVPLITPETGLIGYPSKTEKGINFKSLLNPKIRPTRGVELKTQQFAESFSNLNGPVSPKILLERANSGKFKVTRAKHKGDTFQGPWETEVEAIVPG